jgi:hypothetical protein
VLGPLAGMVPLFVALSCIGSLNGVSNSGRRILLLEFYDYFRVE